MADSGALRAKRHRLHRGGNHTLCKDPARCGRVTPAPSVTRNVAPRTLTPDQLQRQLALLRVRFSDAIDLS